MTWHPNIGEAPFRDPEDGPPITHVHVRLRNGVTPADKWPVDTGRGQTTRWSLIGCGFDIVEWREA